MAFAGTIEVPYEETAEDNKDNKQQIVLEQEAIVEAPPAPLLEPVNFSFIMPSNLKMEAKWGEPGQTDNFSREIRKKMGLARVTGDDEIQYYRLERIREDEIPQEAAKGANICFAVNSVGGWTSLI